MSWAERELRWDEVRLKIRLARGRWVAEQDHVALLELLEAVEEMYVLSASNDRELSMLLKDD